MLSIPSDWSEELEDDEVRLYYQDVPQSGGFRVRVKTFGGSQQINSEVVAGLLLDMAGQFAPDKELEVVQLPDGNLMVSFLQHFLEDDPPIIMATWLVGIAVPPRYIQIASFNYTALAKDAGSVLVGEEMKLLEGCVHGAKYEVALEGSGPPRKKAWWKRGT